jgi:hypothetical protein
MMGEGRPRRGKVEDEVEIGRDLEAGSELTCNVVNLC